MSLTSQFSSLSLDADNKRVLFDPLIANIFLAHLDATSLCRVASVCKEFKKLAYNPIYWITIDLPYPGGPQDNVNYEQRDIETLELAKKLGIYSTMRPPADPLALEKLLQSMMPGKQRFVNTKDVKFKNYMFSDESLQLTADLFPSIERLDLDGGRLTTTGYTILPQFKKLRFLSVYCEGERKLDSLTNSTVSETLERLVATRFSPKQLRESLVPFMKQCAQCSFYYNPKLNTATSCLYHPEEYTGYGHSCSSYLCCGSMTPAYMGTPGCTYGFHADSFIHSRMYTEVWLPEYYDVPYDGKTAPYFFRRRRDPRSTK